MTAPRFDRPTVEEDSRPFWEAANKGHLLIKRCGSCGAAHHYPRPFCPTCWSEDVRWEVASGRGHLYTWSTVYVNDLPPFSERLPYVAAAVDLEEGPRLMTNLVDCDLAELFVGMPVVVTFRELDEQITAPMFTVAGSHGRDRPASASEDDRPA